MVSFYRITVGLMLLQFVLLLWPDLAVWYGPGAVISQECILKHYPFPVFNLLNLLPANSQSMTLIFALLTAAAASMTLGFQSQLAAFIAFLCLVTIYHVNPYLLNSGDTYLRQQVFWLILSPAGKELSLEKLIQRNKRYKYCALASPWVHRMMQFQFCLVYADSFIHKINDKSWIDGSAVYYSSHLLEFQKFPVPFIFDNATCCKYLTWGTLGVEAALFTLIWIKPVRYLVILAAIIFHLTIDWTMNIPQFEWLMIFSLILFVDVEDLPSIYRTKSNSG